MKKQRLNLIQRRRHQWRPRGASPTWPALDEPRGEVPGPGPLRRGPCVNRDPYEVERWAQGPQDPRVKRKN